MNWIDIVVLALIVIFAIVGLCKGFLSSILSLCSIFVSLLIAIATSNWFAGLIRRIVDIDGWFDHILADRFNVGESMVVFGTSYPREKIAAFLTVVACTIVMFIFIRCLIALIKKLFESLTEKSKTLGFVNRLFGLIFGAIKGGVVVIVVLILCSVITSLNIPGVSSAINNTINDTKVTSWVYGYVDKAVDDKLSGKSFEEIIKGLFDEDKAKDQENATTISVIYPEGTDYYTFTLNEKVDYSKIIVMYNNGETLTQVEITTSNFTDAKAIDTSTAVATPIETTITVYGKTTTFRYIVVNAA